LYRISKGYIFMYFNIVGVTKVRIDFSIKKKTYQILYFKRNYLSFFQKTSVCKNIQHSRYLTLLI